MDKTGWQELLLSRIGPIRPQQPATVQAHAWLAGRNAASSPAGRGGALQDRRDFLDLVQLTRGDLHDQLVGLVVGERQAAAVQAVEGDHRGEREPLVAVDQGMVAGQECSSAAALASRDE